MTGPDRVAYNWVTVLYQVKGVVSFAWKVIGLPGPNCFISGLLWPGRRSTSASMLKDPKLAALRGKLPKPQTLSLSFESAVFHDNWQGVIEFQFKTEKAQEFYDAMRTIGVQ